MSILYEEYLKDHEAPEDAQYYTCGPPMMSKALVKMLTELGWKRMVFIWMTLGDDEDFLAYCRD